MTQLIAAVQKTFSLGSRLLRWRREVSTGRILPETPSPISPSEYAPFLVHAVRTWWPTLPHLPIRSTGQWTYAFTELLWLAWTLAHEEAKESDLDAASATAVARFPDLRSEDLRADRWYRTLMAVAPGQWMRWTRAVVQRLLPRIPLATRASTPVPVTLTANGEAKLPPLARVDPVLETLSASSRFFLFSVYAMQFIGNPETAREVVVPDEEALVKRMEKDLREDIATERISGAIEKLVGVFLRGANLTVGARRQHERCLPSEQGFFDTTKMLGIEVTAPAELSVLNVQLRALPAFDWDKAMTPRTRAQWLLAVFCYWFDRSRPEFAEYPFMRFENAYLVHWRDWGTEVTDQRLRATTSLQANLQQPLLPLLVQFADDQWVVIERPGARRCGVRSTVLHGIALWLKVVHDPPYNGCTEAGFPVPMFGWPLDDIPPPVPVDSAVAAAVAAMEI